MKMTVLLAAGGSITIEVQVEPGMTDEDAVTAMTNRWVHALTCQMEVHLMRFRHSPGGECLVLAPDAIAGFSLKVDTLQ